MQRVALAFGILRRRSLTKSLEDVTTLCNFPFFTFE